MELGNEIFVVGYARSGTSILNEILNADPRVCILGEPNFHFHWGMKSFVYKFNRQHALSNRRLNRATFLPNSMIGINGEQAFDMLRRNFDFPGAKVAFNPVRDDPSISSQDVFLDFHMVHFPRSKYVLSIREPYSACLSARKLFAGASEKQIFLGWLSSMLLSMLASQVFVHSFYVPLEWLVSGIGARLGQALDLNLDMVETWLEPPKTAAVDSTKTLSAEMESFLERLELADSDASPRQLFEAAYDVYMEFIRCIDPQTLRLKSPFTPVALLDLNYVDRIRTIARAVDPLTLDGGNRNRLNAAHDLTNAAWSKSSLTVECLQLKEADKGAVFLLKDMPVTDHKSLTQVLANFSSGDALEFTFKAKSHGLNFCAAQVGNQQTMCFASFDLAQSRVHTMHNGSGLSVLDSHCERGSDGWVKCSLIISADEQAGLLFSRLYLLNNDGGFEFMGSGTNGILIKDISVAKFAFVNFF